MIGIRGAAGVAANTAEAILAATREMLEEIVRRNRLDPVEVTAAFFTLTPDLDAAFPAAAARQIGWGNVPLMCAQEIDVPGAPPAIVRVLLLADRPGPAHHVYLGSARALRPDLAEAPRSAPGEGGARPGAEAEPGASQQFRKE